MKVEPGERNAWEARLNWLSLKSLPPTIERTRPVPGSIDTTAPSIAPGVWRLIVLWAFSCQSMFKLVRIVRPPTSSCSLERIEGSSCATQLVK